jgi:hypothetical protein
MFIVFESDEAEEYERELSEYEMQCEGFERVVGVRVFDRYCRAAALRKPYKLKMSILQLSHPVTTTVTEFTKKVQLMLQQLR